MPKGIPNSSSIRWDPHNVFTRDINTRGTDPSLTNLYSVVFTPPPMFASHASISNALYTKFLGGRDNSEMARMLNMYCTAVNLPSKQLTTAQVITQGVAYKYATGTAYSQINITFMMPRNQSLRNLFESWMNGIIADANHYVEDYEEYVCPRLRIYKLERGFLDETPYPEAIKHPRYTSDIRRSFGSDPRNYERPKLNQCTACFELYNVFPYNIGSAQLNNTDSRLLTYSIGFNFERYRFHVRNDTRMGIGEVLTKNLTENLQTTEPFDNGKGQRMS